jgi:hypothetical protein
MAAAIQAAGQMIDLVERVEERVVSAIVLDDEDAE